MTDKKTGSGGWERARQSPKGGGGVGPVVAFGCIYL